MDESAEALISYPATALTREWREWYHAGNHTGDDGDASARASPQESRLRWNPAEMARLTSPPEQRLMAVRRRRRASEGLRV